MKSGVLLVRASDFIHCIYPTKRKKKTCVFLFFFFEKLHTTYGDKKSGYSFFLETTEKSDNFYPNSKKEGFVIFFTVVISFNKQNINVIIL